MAAGGRERPLNAVFKALADPTRRQILRMLKAGDLSAGDIARAFHMTWPSVSHHLGLLKEAGLVTAERQGQHIVYSLNMSVLQEALTWLLGFAEERGGTGGEA